jgi:chemotaxis protein MotA
MGGDLHMFISEHARSSFRRIAATMIRFPYDVARPAARRQIAFTMSRLSARDLVDELARIAEIARKQDRSA